MTQKASAMGNWSLVASLLQCTCSCITSCADFFAETSDHPGNSALLQSRFVALWLLAFHKTKITFEREEFSDHQWDSGKYNRAADGDWENYVRSQSSYFEGDWGIIVLCTVFLVSCISFNKCLYFSYYIAGYLLDIYTYTHIHAYICAYTHTHIHIYTYIYVYAHIHIYIYIVLVICYWFYSWAKETIVFRVCLGWLKRQESCPLGSGDSKQRCLFKL